MRRFRAACGAGVAAAVLLATPAPSLAASQPCVPPPVIPEVPGSPVLLVVVGAAVLGLLTLIRRRRGAPPAALTTLVVVVIAGAVLGLTVAGAATDPCGGGAPGGVLGTSTGTPLTGAAIPWITGGVLIVLGVLTGGIALCRRSWQRRWPES